MSTVHVEVGPLWDQGHAEEVAAEFVSQNPGTEWTGQWWTTVPGEMSVIQIRYTPAANATVKSFPDFNGESDCEILKAAMKGFGTDEDAIIDVITARTNAQRQEIKDMFKQMYGKDLTKELKSELGGRFEDAVLALMLKPAEFDARQLKDAMGGIGTKESVLIEIMCSRTNEQIADIKDAYKKLTDDDLESDLGGDTGGHFERLMISLCTGNRQEDSGVDFDKAQADAQELFDAGENKVGTDESVFNKILAAQGFEQLRVVFKLYGKLGDHSLEEDIDSEFSGDIKDGLLAIVKCVNNRPAYFAERLYHSMKGAGTKDVELIRVVVSRCEIEMKQIKDEFLKMYEQTLEDFIENDVSGDYRKLLLRLVQ